MFENAPNNVKYGYLFFVLVVISAYAYWLMVAKGKLGITDATTAGTANVDGTATTGTASTNVKLGVFVVAVAAVGGVGVFLNNKYKGPQ
jgi:hypothetical protein